MTRILIGYFIRRSIRDADTVRGKTFSAYAHRLFAERWQADDALARERVGGGLDDRFDYDIAEAYMLLDGEP